jgi:exosortase
LNSTLSPQHTTSVAAADAFVAKLLLFATLAFLWFQLCRQLAYEWSANEQYRYGWFVPFLAGLLFWLRWERSIVAGLTSKGPNDSIVRRDSRRRGLGVVLSLVLLLLPIRLFEIANPDWRPLSWLHAFTVIGISLLIIASSRGRTAVRHLAFPICFILVAVPWVSPVEEPIVQSLMKLIAAGATETLGLLGIPAQVEGTLIRISTGTVGVNEACSGARSLQTSLMIGLLFGELWRLTISRRVALVLGALTIALLANFARALFLVWIAATENLVAVERWHDFAGNAIVLAVFLGTIAIAVALSAKGESDTATRETDLGAVRRAVAGTRLPPTLFLISTLALLLFLEAAAHLWYRWHERNLVATMTWNVRWPENAPGFRDVSIAENIRSTLHYDQGREAMWRLDSELPNDPHELPSTWTMFFFRWAPGSTTILRARAHRPDICLPSSGWKLMADAGTRSYVASREFAVEFRHFRFVRRIATGRNIFAETFFAQREDRVLPSETRASTTTTGKVGTWLRSDRIRVVREGLRNQGQQVMELVLITPNELTNEAAEATFAKLLPTLIVPENRAVPLRRAAQASPNPRATGDRFVASTPAR